MAITPVTFLLNTDPGSYKFTIRTKRKRTKSANETNERFTRTIRKTHDIRTNEMHRTNYTENANERTHDTRSERTIHVTNARYTNERIIGV